MSAEMHKESHNSLKIWFGLLIFLFGMTFAFTTAPYAESHGIADYWTTLAVISVLYVLGAVMTWSVSVVSLGLLYGADLLILHLMFGNYGRWGDGGKAVLVLTLLVILYAVAYWRLKDDVIDPHSDVPMPPAPIDPPAHLPPAAVEPPAPPVEPKATF